MKTNSIIKSAVIVTALLFSTAGIAKAGDAKELFEKSCASCHGKDGKGDTKMGKKLDVKDYTDAKVQDALKDADAIKAIKEGIKDDKGGKDRMKAYGEQLSEDEIKSLVAYVRAFKAK